MKSAKMPNGYKRYPIAVYTSTAEKEKIDSFFSSRPALKKGETVKRWILHAIEAEQDIQSGKTQVSPEIIKQ